MKNKKLSIYSYIFTIGIFILLAIITTFLLIKPGIIGIKDANKIIVLSDKEKDALVLEINNKYVDLYKTLDDKYSAQYLALEEKYVTKYQEVDAKYATILEEHEAKYNRIEEEIKANYENQINEIEAQYDLPMMDSRWFEYQQKANDEIAKIRTKMYDEIEEKTTGKSGEWLTIQKNKNSETGLVGRNKQNEQEVIDENKMAEKSALDRNKLQEINDVTKHNQTKESLLIRSVIKIVLGIIILIMYIVTILKIFNKLTRYKNMVKESWSGIDVLLKRRFDLLPNYIEIVKSYARHEKSTFKEVTLARADYDKAKTKDEEISANENATSLIAKLIMLSEKYPELKANKNFLSLQTELKNTEDAIAAARIVYNKNVLKYKNAIQTFPTNLIAAIFKFEDEKYFDIMDKEKINVKI